jgi:hypothetical protein
MQSYSPGAPKKQPKRIDGKKNTDGKKEVREIE